MCGKGDADVEGFEKTYENVEREKRQIDPVLRFAVAKAFPAFLFSCFFLVHTLRHVRYSLLMLADSLARRE